MSMTRKDYELIARVIRVNVDGAKQEQRHSPSEKVNLVLDAYTSLVVDLSYSLANASPAFKRDVFQKACGL